MEEAAQADRVLVMSRGRVVLEGTPAQVFSQTRKLKGYHLDVPQAELRDALAAAGLPMPEQIVTPKPARRRFMRCCVRSRGRCLHRPGNLPAAGIPAGGYGIRPCKIRIFHRYPISNFLHRAQLHRKSPGGMRREGNTMSEIIRCEHLRYVYNPGLPDETAALDDVSFSIEEGTLSGSSAQPAAENPP